MKMDFPDEFEEVMALLSLNRALRDAAAGTAEADPGAFEVSLATLRATDGETAAVRLDKVARVRAALSAGTYSVAAEAVAGKMLDGMLEAERKHLRTDRRRRPRPGHRGVMRGRATGQWG
ncbi:MAG TPA: flagellar biosynthesis anti-sigma factor FlgM [Terracidiphilus sp.]|nr:flagellar biosynthesis anti-sigma factor FlgM [Terracidiphilus sp.]